MKPMELKWESNSRVKSLIGRGIEDGDIISRCTTADFPQCTATVRLHQVKAPNPVVTIHFKGESKPHSYNYWDHTKQKVRSHTVDRANTLRVQFRTDGVDFSSTGDMDFSDLPEVNSMVNRVKGVLDK